MTQQRKPSKAFGMIFAVVISLVLLGNIFYNGTVGLIASFHPETEALLQNDAQKKKDQSLQERFDSSLFFNHFAGGAMNFFQQMNGGDFTFVDGVNDIYRDETGRLTYVCRRLNMLDDAESLAAFSSSLEQKGIPLLYVQAPFKILRDEQDLHYHIQDYSNDNADRFLTAVSRLGVDTFDLRDVLKETDRSVAPLFFRYDSRWRVNTAFDAYLSVLTLLDHRYHLCRDTAKLFGSRENFTVTQIDHSFLGNQGALAVKAKAGDLDSFDYIKPYSRTAFELEILKADGTLSARTGDYSAALMVEQKSFDSLYDSYLGAPSPKISIRNQQVKTGEKVLIFGDDFINPFASFTALNFSQTVVVNPALYQGSLQELVTEEKPDLVLVLYNPKSFENPEFFRFS